MAGYWRNPEATAAAVRDGWLWTGDVGSLDEDGFLTLKDRSKDLMISGGSNIYPREVEEVLLTAPGVAEAAVVGAPDPEWGEIVVAFVVARPGQRLDASDARRVLPGTHRPLQAAQALPVRRGTAEEQLRQGAEDRAACAPARAAMTHPAGCRAGDGRPCRRQATDRGDDLRLSGAEVSLAIRGRGRAPAATARWSRCRRRATRRASPRTPNRTCVAGRPRPDARG